LSNHRTDEYGGSLEKRFTFACEVVEAVRKEVGPDFCILFRLGADDLMDGGLTLEDSKLVAPRLVEAGVDLFDLSGGFGGYRTEAEQGYFSYMTEGFKQVVDIPLLTTGGILVPEVADRILAEGKTDLVGVGRAMLEDYDWAAKAINRLSK
jgi:2,4-dienoyl-CoA reductase-like NADH-dependent reductase (Old Yellow Enzyme family)